MKKKIEVGDIVLVKDNTYGSFKVHKILPKGSYGRNCVLVEVIHDSMVPPSFEWGLIKTFRMIDLKHAPQTA